MKQFHIDVDKSNARKVSRNKRIEKGQLNDVEIDWINSLISISVDIDRLAIIMNMPKKILQPFYEK